MTCWVEQCCLGQIAALMAMSFVAGLIAGALLSVKD
jgi:hypothetical protein